MGSARQQAQRFWCICDDFAGCNPFVLKLLNVSATTRCLVMATRQQGLNMSTMLCPKKVDVKAAMPNWIAACGHRSSQVRPRQPEKNEGHFFQTERMFFHVQVIRWKKHARNTPQHSRKIPATHPQHPQLKENMPFGGSRLTEIALSDSFLIKHLPNVENSEGSLRRTHRHGHASPKNVEKQQRRLQAAHSLGDNFSFHGAQ